MTGLFTSAKSVFCRASQHITSLKTEINTFTPGKPYTYTVDVDADGITHKFKFSESFSDDISCIMFDAINNLRASLDHMTYAIAVNHCGRDDIQALFPFAKDAAHWPAKINGLKDVPSEICAVFKRFKPYKGGNDILWAINYMANIKKHAVLIPVGFGRAALWESDPGCDTTIHGVWNSKTNEIVLRTTRDANFEAKRNFTYSIVIHDAEEIIDGESPVMLLDAMSGEVNRVLMATEAECRRIGFIA